MKQSVQELYGGHFTIELINGSENYVDASTIREVPDNQEVFVGKNDDTSVIIDLLEQVESTDLKAAMTEHLEDILTDLTNSIIKQDDTVLRKDIIDNNLIITKLTVDKSANLSKEIENNHIEKGELLFKESEPLKTIDMYIGLVRLKEYETDILITYNPPPRSKNENIVELFKNMILSLTLKDPSIFG